MKKLVASLTLAINFTASFSSYAAEAQDNGSGLGEDFDTPFTYRSSDSPQLPLPHLPRRQEMAAQREETPLLLSSLSLQDREEQHKKRQREQEQLDEPAGKRARLTPSEQLSTSSTTSSSSSSSTSHFEYPAGESPLEQLPQELFEHIRRFVSPHHREALTSASQSLRGRSQATVTHLTIPVSDITPENLHNAEHKFPKVTSLTITRAPKEAAITPVQIILLAIRFPYTISLDLSNTGLTTEQVIALAYPHMFEHLKNLDVSYNSQFRDTDTRFLANASFARTLKSLNLAGNSIGDAGIAELARAPFILALEFLNLQGTGITLAEVYRHVRYAQ